MRDPKEFRERFQRWKNGENYWEQRGISMNTQQSQDQQADLLTPEQLTAIEAALEYYTSGKDAVDDVPPEITDDNRPNLFQYSDGHYVYQQPGGEETQVTPTAISQSMFDDPKYWSYTDIEGRRYTPKNYPQRQLDILTEGKPYTPIISDIGKYFDELAYRAKEDPSSILLQGKYTMPLILSPLLGKSAIAGSRAILPAAKKAVTSALTPGSSFWTNPITQQMVAGTAAAETVNLGTKVLTGRNSFGQLIGDAVEDVSGWNPNNTLLGPLVTETLNPGWYRTPSKMVMDAVGRVGSAIESTPLTINRAVTTLQNNYPALFDPYTSWDATLGYHGDNIFSRAIGTIGRRHGYTPKGEPNLKYNTPQITSENAASITSDTMTDVGDFSYKGLTSDTHDLFERMVYNDKIHGKPTYLFEQSVQTGIPETEYNELLHDVVGRNVREFKQAGLDDAQINAYISNAKNAMDNVRIGMYSDLDYKKAGMERFGGFYDNKGNFISINTGSTYTKPKTVKHEGRHLLDHKVDDELLMPTSNNFGNDFDSDIALSTMQKVKQNQNMILYDAYDNDFVTLPSKKGFNEGLEEYLYMDREAITTNLDARNELLGRKASWDINITDKIIDRVSDSAIFEAVEKANGYGRRYIRFLRENNKLTPKKAKQFREAMKHVGAIAAPMGVVGLGASITSDQKNTYNRGKDKGIHINPKNRGKFNALKKRTGKTTEQLTHSKNPLTRKRAIFAQNTKKWKKK